MDRNSMTLQDRLNCKHSITSESCPDLICELDNQKCIADLCEEYLSQLSFREEMELIDSMA